MTSLPPAPPLLTSPTPLFIFPPDTPPPTRDPYPRTWPQRLTRGFSWGARYSMMVDNGFIKVLKTEKSPGDFTVSSGEEMLKVNSPGAAPSPSPHADVECRGSCLFHGVWL